MNVEPLRVYVFEKSLPYGAELLRVMTEEGGPQVANPALTFEQTVDAKGAKVLVWAARDVAPGTRLNLELSDVPGASIWARLGDTLASPSVLAAFPWVLAALVGLLPVLGVFWTLRGRARPQPASSSKPLPRSPVDAVAEALVDLDDAFAVGRVSEPEYHKRRRQLKTQLRDQLRPAQAPLTADKAPPG